MDDKNIMGYKNISYFKAPVSGSTVDQYRPQEFLITQAKTVDHFGIFNKG